MLRNKTILLLAGLTLLILACPTQAQFALLENFDGLTPGNVDGQQSAGGSVWDTQPEGASTQTVMATPAGDAGDQVLRYWGGGNIEGSHVHVGDPAVEPHSYIADNAAGTVFFRMYLPANTRAFHWIGLTDLVGEYNSGTAATLFINAIILYSSSAAATPYVYGATVAGPPHQNSDPLTSFEPDTWHNIWLVVHNDTNTWDLYMNTGNAAATPSHLVAAGLPFWPDSDEAPAFTGIDLKGVIMRGHSTSGDIFLDDIYWDGAAVNLANPAAGGSAHSPSPQSGAVNVPIDTMLSWQQSELLEPGAIYQQDVFMTMSPTDPNLGLLATLDGTTLSIDPAAHGRPLQRDATYAWRVDTHAFQADPKLYSGPEWSFQTEPEQPIITTQPQDVLTELGANAQFSVDAYNPFTGTDDGLAYQWYKAADPGTPLADGAEFSGTNTPALTVLDVQPADEGNYLCTVQLVSNSAIVNSQAGALAARRLMAHWKFDGNYEDASPNAFHADPNGTVQFVDGIVPPTADGAARIDTANGWATAGTWGPAVYSNQFTIMGWVRPADTYNSDGAILAKRDTWNSSEVRWSLRIDDTGELRMHSPGTGIVTTETANFGEWNHLAAVYHGAGPDGVMRIFLNGLPTENLHYPLADGLDATMRIGHADALQNQIFNGDIDDLRVYNYAWDTFDVIDQYYAITGQDVCLTPLDPRFDVNQDCRVDLKDLAGFGSAWLNSGLYPN